jgi:hypothetical protein
MSTITVRSPVKKSARKKRAKPVDVVVATRSYGRGGKPRRPRLALQPRRFRGPVSLPGGLTRLPSFNTLTHDGRAWLEKYLHPPGRGGPCGMPDDDTSGRVLIGMRDEMVIAPPSNVGTGSWSVLFYVPPQPEVAAYGWRWLATGTPTALYTPDFILNMGQGNVGSTFWSNLQYNAENLRTTARSVTTRLIAPQTASQGVVSVAQTRSQPSQTGADSNVEDQDLVVQTMPFTGSGIRMMSQDSATWEAAKGSYSQLRLAQPVNRYTPAVQNTNIRLVEHSSSTRILQTPQWLTPHSFTSCFILYEGLSGSATVQFKDELSLEAQPVVGGGYTPFAVRGTPPDPDAIRLAGQITSTFPDAWPADANDLAGIIDVLRSLGAGALRVMGPVLSGMLSATPFAAFAPAAGVATNALAEMVHPQRRGTPYTTYTNQGPMTDF